MGNCPIKIFFNIQVDCEATRQAVNDANLGERAVCGLGEILAETGMKCTFAVIPSDIKVHGRIYRKLATQGHEIGLHIHSTGPNHEEFLGIYGYKEQSKIITGAMDVFSQSFGELPKSFTPGYASANDYTFPVLESLGFKHGTVSIPTRVLPKWVAVWAGTPLEIHYPHRHNRLLAGNVDFVEIPCTVDPEPRVRVGTNLQDLRVELVDAKNYRRTIQKNVKRQIQIGEGVPVKHLKALTHNIFDYLDERNVHRKTLLGIIATAKDICARENCELIAATNADIAAEYRRLIPLPKEKKIDARGSEPDPSRKGKNENRRLLRSGQRPGV